MAPLLMNSGRAIITNLVSGIGGTVPKFLGIGTGATAESATQTALVTEVETRSGANTPTRTTVSVTNDTVSVVQTITATAPRALQESALFDAVSSGNMLVRGVFTTINLATSDSIQVTWTLQFT